MGNLPANRYLSGFKSREIRAGRSNQLRFDDTEGEINAQLASDHGASELNLGYLSTQQSQGHGKCRGEGIELRTDKAIAIRGARGLFLSAWGRLRNEDQHLARNEMQIMLDQCAEMTKSLGEYAEDHQALPTSLKEQSELSATIEKWEHAGVTNTSESLDALIALSSPSGISFATSKASVTYAGTSIESYAQNNFQISVGQQVTINASNGMSLFSKENGLRAIAHHGHLLLQSQHGDTVINASKNINFTASDGKLVGMAKEIALITEDGSFIKIGNGITIGTKGAMNFHGASFEFSPGKTMAASFPEFSELKNDTMRELEIEFVDADGNKPSEEKISVLFHHDNSKIESTALNGISEIKDTPKGSFTIFQTARRK